MKNKLNKYIKELSLNDKKTLTEKVAKLFEEGGELAKVVLPFEGAYATNHRVTDKKRLLEECVDVFLVNQSIMYSLGFSDEEFEDLVFEKAQVWNTLQVKEDRALANGDTMPYEIHVTVNAENGIDVEQYKKDCKKIGVKPILLELQNQSGSTVMDDVMTSSKIYGNNGEAFDEMKRISNSLKEKGYNVIREKIEASYWHQKAPFIEDGDSKMPEGCYFECHFNVLCDYEKMTELSRIAKENNCHLSKNIFKKLDDNTFTIMLTYRSYTDMYEDFENNIDNIKNILKSSNFKVEKEIVEFSIYDTKLTHDSKWLESK
jgi:NTP pyrophosphatase (non-canonical NTP hydrolase)